MVTRAKADKPKPELWQTLDWSSNGPFGAAQSLKVPLPCIICQQPAYLMSPEKQKPAHKVCAERFVLVKYLSSILVELGRER